MKNKHKPLKTIKRILKKLFVSTLCKVFFRMLPPLKLGEEVYVEKHTEVGAKISKRKHPILSIDVSLDENGTVQIQYLVGSCRCTYSRLEVWRNYKNGYWYAAILLLSLMCDKIEQTEVMEILSDIVKFDNKNKEYKPSIKLIHVIKEVFRDENLRTEHKFVYAFLKEQEENTNEENL